MASAVRKDRVLELLGRGDGGEYYVVVNPIHAGACWVGIRSVNFSGDPGSLRIIPVPTAIPILPLAPGTAPGLDILFRLPPLLPQF